MMLAEAMPFLEEQPKRISYKKYTNDLPNQQQARVNCVPFHHP
jgi:hypothetical protein